MRGMRERRAEQERKIALARRRLAGGSEGSGPGNSLKRYEGIYWGAPRRREGNRKQEERVMEKSG